MKEGNIQQLMPVVFSCASDGREDDSFATAQEI